MVTNLYGGNVWGLSLRSGERKHIVEQRLQCCVCAKGPAFQVNAARHCAPWGRQRRSFDVADSVETFGEPRRGGDEGDAMVNVAPEQKRMHKSPVVVMKS
mmetsp:Transcript_52669/g.162126  ORF Transcript_52669/g.162126 Transcript_52669/m.162126 type:complete len:100 (-) Transcript_52669:79-378(-)